MKRILRALFRHFLFAGTRFMANVTATAFTMLGGQFQIGNGANPEIFQTIAQVKDVDFDGGKVEIPEVTSADNTDGVKRFVPTLFDPGNCTVVVIWNPEDSSHQQLETSFLAKQQWNFKRVLAGVNGTRSFAGIIESLGGKEPIDKPVEKTIKIKLTGPWTDSGGSE